jgi:hypothetical protein
MEKGAKDVRTTGGQLVWHVDSHWNPTASVVLAELQRMRPPA